MSLDIGYNQVDNNQSTIIGPQEGPQSQFLASEADITIYGGSAGSGKTFGMLLDPLRHVNSCPDGGAVYFRRTLTQVKNEGGLFDEATEFYTKFGAVPRSHPSMDITFPHPTNPDKDGFSVTFASLQHEKDKYNYQGAQIAVEYWDELTHFSRSQFMYLVGRNRSTCGIKPYIRATCNPDKKSWVRKFIDWWIGKDGYADWSKSGVIRWLIVDDDKDYWFDSKELALKQFPGSHPLSVTFIPARLKDNKILNEKDPSYRAKLKAMSKVERERLLGDEEKGGNWDIEATSGSYFQRHYFEEVDAHPPLVKTVRAWDRAATEHKEGDSGDPDWTVGLKLGVDKYGIYYVLDVVRARYSAHKVEQLILNTASQDGRSTIIKGFIDPGGAGKAEAEHFIRMLAGYIVEVERVTKDKITMAKSVSAQAEAGNIKILSYIPDKIKEAFYNETQNFPKDKHDDIVDALSSAFNCIALGIMPKYTKEMRDTKIKTILKRKTKEKW